MLFQGFLRLRRTLLKNVVCHLHANNTLMLQVHFCLECLLRIPCGLVRFAAKRRRARRTILVRAFTIFLTTSVSDKDFLHNLSQIQRVAHNFTSSNFLSVYDRRDLCSVAVSSDTASVTSILSLLFIVRHQATH